MLTPSDLSAIRTLWTLDDLMTAQKAFLRAHPDAAGVPVTRRSPAALIEQRITDILAQRLNAQLAVTTLIPAAQQDMADRLDALWENVTVSEWTTLFPPPVAGANMFIGDILETLGAGLDSFLIVTETLPAGVDVERGALGTVSRENMTVHILYGLPYEGERQRQIEALCGAAAISDLLGTYQQDPVTLWVNGQVTSVSRNVPRLASGARFILGIVTFTCTAFLPYTRTTA